MSEKLFAAIRGHKVRVDRFYRDAAKSLGTRCRCGTCGYVQEVDPAECLRGGWPKCCGYTMTLLAKGEAP
jgi:hypothetical protein